MEQGVDTSIGSHTSRREGLLMYLESLPAVRICVGQPQQLHGAGPLLWTLWPHGSGRLGVCAAQTDALVVSSPTRPHGFHLEVLTAVVAWENSSHSRTD